MLNLALIGCGRWGRNYLSSLRSLEGARLYAVCDSNARALDWVRETLPEIHTYSRVEECLDNQDIGAGVVATPPRSHHAIARALLDTGRHVLVEKPFALSLAEALALVELGESRNLVVMAGHLTEYQPITRITKDLLAGLEGPTHISTIRCSRRPPNTGSVIWDLLVHDIARLHYLEIPPPEAVAALGFQEASVTVLWRTASGHGLHLTASWDDHLAVRHTKILGKGYALSIDEAPPNPRVRLSRHLHGTVSTTSVEGTGNALTEQCRHFLDCVKTGARPVTGPGDIEWVTAGALAAQLSLESGGKWVPWPL
jgi:predicted dehydrogenase